MSHSAKPDFPLLPAPPQPQGVHSQTFKQAPMDGSMSLPEIYGWHAVHSPNHPVFVYPEDDGEVRTITFKEATPAFHRAGRLFRSLVKGSPQSLPLIAIMAHSDTITSFTVFVGALHVGIPTFSISPRNSAAAVAHLLSKTRPTHIFVGRDKPYQELAAAAFKIMTAAGEIPPVQLAMPLFEDLYLGPDAPFEPLPAFKPNLDELAFVLHSSGSTAYPKPISFTYRRQLFMARSICYGELDLAGMVLASHSLPMFHIMGILTTFMVAIGGCCISVYKPQHPAVVPTAESMMAAIVATKAELVVTIPSFISTWLNNPELLNDFKKIKIVFWGGGPLAKEIGDRLVAEHINSSTLYGMTEFGVISHWLIKDFNEDWEYFRITPDAKVELVPVHDGNVQAILPVSGWQIPAVINTKINGVDAYDTSDIYAPHPTKSDLWRVYGRADDQIVHSSGEKTNPGPLEQILKEDPNINVGVMFGHGWFNTGILADPIPSLQFDPKDAQKLAQFRNMIWPTVEKMNEFAPQHSRVFKEMVIVSSPEKPFTFTGKGTPRRQAIINEYKPEIEAAYAAADESAQADLEPPSIWTIDATTSFVREVVSRVMEVDAKDNDDLFSLGCDSLQATWIRNSLLRALRVGSSFDIKQIPNNFVYQHSTIAALSELVHHCANGRLQSKGSDGAVNAMLAMVDKYSRDFATHRPRVATPNSRVFVVTGTTGGLGCALLAHLSGLPDVRRIYAMNRTSQVPLAERQTSELANRGYDVQRILGGGRVVLLNAVASEPDFGLKSSVYEEIRTSVTDIILNAWPVNFNLSLRAFETNVQSVRHFVDLALSSPHHTPPRITFMSSIGVLKHVDLSKPVKECAVEPSVAVGTGYSESKWVTEKLLQNATAATSIRAVSVRVGQLSGSTTNGAWNHDDWLPSLVKSSVYLKCMPTMSKNISWLPLDDAARVIYEMTTSSSSPLHLVHPRPVTWSSVMDPLADSFGLRTVSFDEWVSLLEKSGENLSADVEVEVARQNPALKIIDTFIQGRDVGNTSGEALGLPHLDTTNARKASPSLGSDRLPQLNAQDALRWVSYWKSIGFL